jgi:hypothetical protein
VDIVTNGLQETNVSADIMANQNDVALRLILMAKRRLLGL